MILSSAPIVLFTGKGGVGKTSVACATAIGLADEGRRVLLVSTDPASNLDEVLGTDLSGGEAVPVGGVAGLQARNIDPEDAARRYRERVIAPVRGVLPEAAVASIEEQLSGACTVEIAAFDQFARLLHDPLSSGFDHIVFDTAPTGHTLRLLELPAAWTGFFETNTTGTSCLGPLSGLEAERVAYAQALTSLRDGPTTEVVLVARPDGPSLREAARAAGELDALGIRIGQLVVNGIPAALDTTDPVGREMVRAAEGAIDEMPAVLRNVHRVEIPLASRPPMGVQGLRRLGSVVETSTESDVERRLAASAELPPLATLLDVLEAEDRGVILTMGKGGVGKTRIAQDLAWGLAQRGHRVHLTTTDPAGRFDGDEGGDGGAGQGPRVTRIDPETVTRAYAEEVLATAGATLDSAGRALLEEDLRSPCTEEIAVFRAFAEAVAGGEDEFVVIDTAPTGHTLLLMDAAETYHREVLRKPGNAPDAVKRLLPRLRDPGFAKIVLVTLPEPTPVHEARRLQEDLARAGIVPFAWVVNQCLTGLPLGDPFLGRRREGEAALLDEVCSLSDRVVLSPWAPERIPAAAGTASADDLG